MFGAVGDGTTDDTAALQAWAASPYAKVGEPNTYKVTGTLTFSANALKIDGRGMVIDGSSGTVWANASVVSCVGSLSALPALSASPAIRARSLAWASPHGLVEGDVFLIYNPTDYSFCPTFAYGRAGEFCRVQYVTDTTHTKQVNGLHAAYTAGSVSNYKLAKNEVFISDLTVKAPGSGSIRPIEVKYCTRVRISNIACYGSDYTGISTVCCYDVAGEACAVDVNVQLAASKYAWSISNCQHVTINASELNSVRHAVNIGGDDYTGCVPNRDININNSTLRGDSAFSSVPACDIHANTENVTYRDNTIYGGGALGGKDVSYLGNTFLECDTSVSSMLAGGSHWLGGFAKIIGNTFISTGAYAYGIIRGYVDASNTLYDSHFIVRDNIASMGAADTFFRCDHNNTTKKANVHISGVSFLDSASLANICRMSGPGAAVTGDYAIVDDISNGKIGAALYVEALSYTAAKVRLMEQRGSATITIASASTSANASPTFRYTYGSRTPIVSMITNLGLVTGSRSVIPFVGSVSATGFGTYLVAYDGGAFGANNTATAYWSASVSEI
jgi:hypothetical protein